MRLQEAALYGRLSSQKLARWVFGSGMYPPVIESRFVDQRLIAFHDLIQAMAIDRARGFGVPLPKIREAIKRAKERHDVQFPLAYKHQLLWFDRELHIKFPNETIIQLTGREQNQSLIKDIVEPFMKDLHFCDEGLAVSFTPFEKYGRQIILDPQRQFGQPLVGGTGYRADILANMYYVEQSADLVAGAFNIDPKDVLTAVSYMEDLRSAA